MPQSFGGLLGSAGGLLSSAQQVNQAQQQQFSSLSQAVNNPAGAISTLLGGAGGNLTSGLSGIPSLSSLGGFQGMLDMAGELRDYAPSFTGQGSFGSGLPGFGGVASGSTQTMEQVLSHEDPAWQFQWSVDSIVAPPGMPPLPPGCTRPDQFIEAFDVVFPGAQQEINSERGSNVYYTGYMDAPTFSLTLFEYHDWRVTRWLEMWRKCIYDPATGCYGVKDEYAGGLVVSLLDLSRKRPLIRAKMMGVWPMQTNPIQLGGGGERVTLQQEFSQDDIEVS